MTDNDRLAELLADGSSSSDNGEAGGALAMEHRPSPTGATAVRHGRIALRTFQLRRAVQALKRSESAAAHGRDLVARATPSPLKKAHRPESGGSGEGGGSATPLSKSSHRPERETGPSSETGPGSEPTAATSPRDPGAHVVLAVGTSAAAAPTATAPHRDGGLVGALTAVVSLLLSVPIALVSAFNDRRATMAADELPLYAASPGGTESTGYSTPPSSEKGEHESPPHVVPERHRRRLRFDEEDDDDEYTVVPLSPTATTPTRRAYAPPFAYDRLTPPLPDERGPPAARRAPSLPVLAAAAVVHSPPVAVAVFGGLPPARRRPVRVTTTSSWEAPLPAPPTPRRWWHRRRGGGRLGGGVQAQVLLV